MKLAAPSVLLLLSLAAASPVYKVDYVTVTAYTTVRKGWADYTAAYPQSPSTAQPVASSEVPAANKDTSSTEVAETSTVAPVVSDVAASPEPETTTSTTPVENTQAETTPAETTPATESTAATSTQANDDASGTGETFHGEGTYYDTGLGACGIVNTDSDFIVAMSHEYFDNYTPNGNPNKNTLCGKKIIASYEGKSVEVTVTDRCEACKYADLDFSPAAFDTIADAALGRIQISWQWA